MMVYFESDRRLRSIGTFDLHKELGLILSTTFVMTRVGKRSA